MIRPMPAPQSRARPLLGPGFSFGRTKKDRRPNKKLFSLLHQVPDIFGFFFYSNKFVSLLQSANFVPDIALGLAVDIFYTKNTMGANNLRKLP